MEAGTFSFVPVLLFFCLLAGGKEIRQNGISVNESNELIEQLKNMPFIEVGKGVSFQSKNNTFGMTMRARMQSLLEFDLDEDFHHTSMDAEVKRIRLNFEGYVLSPKLLYSIQLGFAPNDTRTVPNGNANFVRNAILYYKPNSTWNFGVGQAKIKSNRAHSNSSSALEFVDRSIVDGQFHLDRDFGFFGEFFHRVAGTFNVSAKASITTGEGRNWGVTVVRVVSLIQGVWNCSPWGRSRERGGSGGRL
ncbi:porin [Parabacteroides distasonis]|nr:porin [Parabacteroides distasonis]